MVYPRNQQVSLQTSKDGSRSIPLSFLIINIVIVMPGRVENIGVAQPFVNAEGPRAPRYHPDIADRRDSVSSKRNLE
jgi:hypothetical protein